MSFSVERDSGKREPFGTYKYRILENRRLIAHYWHDYRGDEHGIDFVDGSTELEPLGRGSDFILGDGSEPLQLSERAVAYLTRRSTT